jgi:hypothetical protein
MPKKGRPSQQEKEIESAPSFKRLKNKHSAVESNINELEHGGLDRCPDRFQRNFNRYVGVSITAYNLHKTGFNPGFVLEYKFLDENYQAIYESEKRVADGYFHLYNRKGPH